MNKGLTGAVKLTMILIVLLISLFFIYNFVIQTTASEVLPAIWTADPNGENKTDFSPEEMVYIEGEGFLADTLVTISVTRPNGVVDTGTETTDPYGTFEYEYALDGITGTYDIFATDGTNIATISFNDSSGAIWTTKNDCGDEQQDINHYNVGEHVYINGAGFNKGDKDWSIKGTPGSCDSNTVVASGNVKIDDSGSFCFDAYTVKADDCGVYKTNVGEKNDNYQVGDWCDKQTTKKKCGDADCLWCEQCKYDVDTTKTNQWLMGTCVVPGTDCGWHCEKGYCGATCSNGLDCSCPKDKCDGSDYYDYPLNGTCKDCTTSCYCENGTSSGKPCYPSIIKNDPRCLCGNGVIDPGEECEIGNKETKQCGTDVGICEFGTKERECTQNCKWGNWSECKGGINPQPEICDGLDNDCGGHVDEGCCPSYSCITPDELGDTQQENIKHGYGVNDDLQKLLDSYGYAINATEDQTNDQIWHIGADTVNIQIELVGKGAAENSNVFGYYLNGSASNFTPLFQMGNHSIYHVPVFTHGQKINITIKNAQDIGFGINSENKNQTQRYLYLTQNSPNPDSKDHAVVFDLCNNTYMIGFEDLYNLGDSDYEDLVVIVKVINCTSGPVCGDGTVKPPEECELPNTNDNPFCTQTTTECLGKKFGQRDAYGNCDSLCGCIDDSFKYSCVQGQCGAECDENSDCPPTICEDGCVGKDWYEYDDVPNTCEADCFCTENECGEPRISYNDPRCTQCQDDDDCNSLDRDYCEGDLIKHDEGKCVNYECKKETTTNYDCNDKNYNECDGTVITHVDYTCESLECVVDSRTPVEDCYFYNKYCSGTESWYEEGYCDPSGPICDSKKDFIEDCYFIENYCKGDDIWYDSGYCYEGECDFKSQFSGSCNNDFEYCDYNQRWLSDEFCTNGQCDSSDSLIEDCNDYNKDYCSSEFDWVHQTSTCQEDGNTICALASSTGDCRDDLFCNGEEYCSEQDGVHCEGGTPVDCSDFDLCEIATCNWIPDSFSYTFDYASPFDSVCDEVHDECTKGSQTLTHTCADSDILDGGPIIPISNGIRTCDAECDYFGIECQNKCVDDIRYYNGNCKDCFCDYDTEDCSLKTDWYDTGKTKWLPTGECTEKEQKEQEYREYNCYENFDVECDYTIKDTKWVETGKTRNKDDGTVCDDGLYCTNPDTCTAGVCGGPSADCSDFTNQCNLGFCNEDNDRCEYALKETSHPCDNGLYCDGPDHCDATDAGGLIPAVCVNLGPSIDCSYLDDECQEGKCDEDFDKCVEDYTNYPWSTPCEVDQDKCTLEHCDGLGECVFWKDVPIPSKPIKVIGDPKIECQDGEWCEWKITTLTPITLTCEEGKVYWRYALDGNWNKWNEDGSIVTIYFPEESNHTLEAYCLNDCDESEHDIEKFKVEGKAFEIPLYKKWNLISVPFVLLNGSVSEVFKNISDTVLSVWTYDNGKWYVWTPECEKPEDCTLKDIKSGWGYWVIAKEDSKLLISGNLFSPITTPPRKDLQEGWNLIGYYGTEWQTYELETDSECGYVNYNYGNFVYCSLNSLIDTQKGLPRWSSLWGYDNCGDDLAYWNELESCFKGFWKDINMYAGKGYWIEMDVEDGYAPASNCIWNEDLHCLAPTL